MGCADEQTSSKGFQAVKPTVWGGVQESVLFPTHPPVLLRESVEGERILAAIRNFA